MKCAEDLYFDIGSAEPTALLLQDLRYFLEYRERALEEYQGHLTVEDVDDFVSGLLVGFLEEFATRAAEDAYRAWVAVYLSDDNRISEIERNILEDKRIELKLSKEQTSAIEAGIEAGEIQSIG